MERDEVMLQEILPHINVTEGLEYSPEPFTGVKNTSIKFLLLPQWSAMFAPFNIAKLSAVTRQAGYTSSCLDLNIKVHNRCKELMSRGELDYYPWDGPRNFKWYNHYDSELHPLFEDILEDAIEEVVKQAPKVIGFTLYWTNQEASFWMLSKLRERLPNTVFIAGGPSSHTSLKEIVPLFDIVVVGEAEQILLEVLDKIETGQQIDFPLVLTQPENQKLNLEQFPIPDYSDFNFSEYIVGNGMLTEFSRGCVAKCTFCEETHFWKYRQRNYMDVVDEIEHLYKTRGVNVVWFLDSLVNGNLTELRNFCEEIIKRDLKIYWFGYARHDKRMDLDFYKLMKKSGCATLTYGSESGSNKVLLDMKKRITAQEMEQNFLDGHKTGITAITGWVISFPTETCQDFVDTMTVLWRNREYIANALGASKFGPGNSTIVGQNPERFDMMDFTYEKTHARKDFTSTKPHMVIRAKSWFIFQQQIISKSAFVVSPRPNLPRDHYTINFHSRSIAKHIEFETFDYSIIKPGINPLADSLINEIFPLFRMIWRCRGGYDMKLICNPEIDSKEFGTSLKTNFVAEYNFSITEDGKWTCGMDLSFKQQDNSFEVYDNSDTTTTSTLRARKLAEPKWGMQGRTQEERDELKKECERLNNEIDYSFDFTWSGKGNWNQKKSLF